MRRDRLDRMTKGWFIGNFAPVAYQTGDVEVAVKKYQVGEREDRHYHKQATEITLILHGEVRMNGSIYKAGDIIIIEPEEATDFEALTETLTVVVKHPGVLDDKFFG